MAIRQTPSAVIVPDIVTGSAYAARDVIGTEFEIPLAAGAYGAWIGALTLIDYASANTTMRLHFFREQPSGYNPSGIAFALADADDDKYIGYTDVDTWVSAGTSKMVGQKLNPGLPLFAASGARSVWCVNEAQASTTFGDSANPLRLSMTNVQDGDT